MWQSWFIIQNQNAEFNIFHQKLLAWHLFSCSIHGFTKQIERNLYRLKRRNLLLFSTVIVQSPQNYCLKGSSFQLVSLLMTSKLDSLFLFISVLFIPLKLVAPSPPLSVNFQLCPTKVLFLERIELPHFLKPGASAGK